jgi:hypothetical protein
MSVTIACSNPGGVILQLSTGQTVQLNGPPLSLVTQQISGSGFTSVAADFWTTWSGNNANSALLASGAVWEI